MIEHVHLSQNANVLTVNVTLDTKFNSESVQYAYYVYRAKKRIHVEWYTTQPMFEFDTQGCSGEYIVQAFVKNAADEICSRISAPLLIDSVEADSADYRRWQLPVRNLSADNLNSLINSDDAIYRITNTNNQVLEVMVLGLHRLKPSSAGENTVLVSFNGAVANRQRYHAPFFSGAGIAKRCNLPLIAFADPSVTADKNLTLGWYAGSEAYPELQKDIARVLDWIAAHNGARFVCFGGSGGGYAILNVLAKIAAPALAFIWNPQTSISEYSPAMVKRYLMSAFPGEYLSQYKSDIRLSNTFFYSVLSNVGIEHDLTKIQLSDNKHVLYIQNSSDIHVLHHAGPFMQEPDWTRQGARIFSSVSKQTTLWFGMWGEGHASPEIDIVYDVLQRILLNQPMLQIATHLDASYNSQLDYFCAFNIDNFTPEITLASCVQGRRAASIALTNCEGFGITYAFQLTDTCNHKLVHWYTKHAHNYMDIPSEFSGECKMTVYVRDALGGKFTKTVSLAKI